MGIFSWLFDSSEVPCSPQRKAVPYETITIAEARELDARWYKELMENYEAAVLALPDDPPFKVSHGGDGWWRVESRSHGSTLSLTFYGTDFGKWTPPIRASRWDEDAHRRATQVRVWREYASFAPTFLTRLEAEQWLAEHIAATEAGTLSVAYNEDGTPAVDRLTERPE
jgi:hypothetical protein